MSAGGGTVEEIGYLIEQRWKVSELIEEEKYKEAYVEKLARAGRSAERILSKEEMLEQGIIGKAIRFRDSQLLRRLGYEHPVDVLRAMKSGEFNDRVRALGYPNFSLYLVYDPSQFAFRRETAAVYTCDPLKCLVIEELFSPRGREEPVVIDRKVTDMSNLELTLEATIDKGEVLRVDLDIEGIIESIRKAKGLLLF